MVRPPTASRLLRGQGRLSATWGRSQRWQRGSRQGALEREGISERPSVPGSALSVVPHGVPEVV